jgi:ankyrin repeat protein
VRPLNTCAFARAHRVARVLLEAGADPNGEGEHGFTPLMAARAHRDAEMERLVLDYGASPDG